MQNNLGEKLMAKILLVDDDPDFNQTLKEWLQAKGYEVLTALDGQQGLKLAQKEKPDLIITDVVMPNKDGFEMLLELQGSAHELPFKVIAISGGGRMRGDMYLELMESMNVDFRMQKPLDLPQLKVKLVELLG